MPDKHSDYHDYEAAWLKLNTSKHDVPHAQAQADLVGAGQAFRLSILWVCVTSLTCCCLLQYLPILPVVPWDFSSKHMLFVKTQQNKNYKIHWYY